MLDRRSAAADALAVPTSAKPPSLKHMTTVCGFGQYGAHGNDTGSAINSINDSRGGMTVLIRGELSAVRSARPQRRWSVCGV